MKAADHSRSAALAAILADPPTVHDEAPESVWRTQDDCYEFLAEHLPEHARTLETGCGISTALFTAWGCDHLCVVPSPEQEAIIRTYCAEMGFDTSGLRFDLRTSDVALPEHAADKPIDLAFIDGSHGFPQALIDWYYTGQLLVAGGISVLDDVWLRNVTAGLTEFLDADPRWEKIAGTWKWSAYRKLSEHSLCEEWTEQRFFENPASQSLGSRLARALPQPVRRPLSRAWHKLVGT